MARISFTTSIIRFTLFLGILIWLYQKIKYNRIKVPCLACESSGFFYKCADGTGKGTHTCSEYKVAVARVQEIKNTIPEVRKTAQKIKQQLMGPIDEVKKSIKSFKDLIGQLEMAELKVPPLKIPEITAMDLVIDFGQIPVIDVCKTIVKPAISSAINPINSTISSFSRDINAVINDVNGVLKDLKMTPIRTMDSLEINVNDFTCAFDMAAQLKSIGLEKIDIGTPLRNGINEVIKVVNIGLKYTEMAINVAIEAIRKAFKVTIDTIKSVMILAFVELRKQMENLNVFGEIVPQLKSIGYNISQLNIFDVLKVTVLPYLKMIIPGAQVIDILIFGLIIVIIGGLLYLQFVVKQAFAPVKMMFNDFMNIIMLSYEAFIMGDEKAKAQLQARRSVPP